MNNKIDPFWCPFCDLETTATFIKRTEDIENYKCDNCGYIISFNIPEEK